MYKYSGVKAVVSMIESGLLRYRLRLNIVPTSYKVFVSLIGVVIGASGMYVYLESPKLIDNVQAKTSPAVKEVVKERDLADYIWFKESTRGKNNYSKCEAKGKVNGIGYGIPGDGSYVCFESHEDEMTALNGWLVAKKASGWSEEKMLSVYSGGSYNK